VRTYRESAALLALIQSGSGRTTELLRSVDEPGGAQALVEREHGLLANELIGRAQAQIDAWGTEQIQVLTWVDSAYPENLRTVPDRPPLLFVAGELQMADCRSVAVIGSRQATREGERMARAIARTLVDSGYTVNSGLAAGVGVPTAAHTESLRRGGRTVAVIGTGLRQCHPPQNAGLQRRIARDCAVLSQFWPDTPPRRGNFPRRNSLMAGISLATVVVEAAARSGARIQARLSLAQGRPVILTERVLEQEWARALLNGSGTHVVTSAAEVPALVDRLSASSLIA
jgi:DNA processing protein